MNNGLSRRNTSCIKGVRWSKTCNNWYVYIGYKGKMINLGNYSSLFDAIQVRLKAETELYKEYASPQLDMFEPAFN